MNILIGCEQSGRVRDAFLKLGHNAWSCDLEPTEVPGPHYQCDVHEILGMGWDVAIFHPPCTYLCSSGLHWNGRVPGRAEKTEEALKFAVSLMAADIPIMAIENPIGCIGTRVCKATQIIQPYQFGEDASKATCLWLIGLPKLIPTKHIAPRIVASGKYAGKRRWANQTDSGQNRETPSDHRSKDRSATYPGIAEAMADQWSAYLGEMRAAA
jgi:hypothetical protein